MNPADSHTDLQTQGKDERKTKAQRQSTKGQRAPGELANLEISRATRVYELLAPDPHICRRTVAELGTAPPEYAQNAADAPEVEGAIVEIRYVGGDVPYSAATHECGQTEETFRIIDRGLSFRVTRQSSIIASQQQSSFIIIVV